MKMRFSLLSVTAGLVGLVLITSCGGAGGSSSKAPTGSNVTISGTVAAASAVTAKTSAVPGQLQSAVSDWEIQVINSDGEVIVTTITDASGSFTVEVPAGGSYTVVAVKGSVTIEAVVGSTDRNNTVTLEIDIGDIDDDDNGANVTITITITVDHHDDDADHHSDDNFDHDADDDDDHNEADDDSDDHSDG